MLSSPKIGVLGGGQLGRMLMEAANRLNIQMNVLDTENAPAKQISAHDGHITGSFTDRASLRKLAEACDILTAEIEHVDTYALEEVASEIKVEPSWKTIRIIQDKFHQKEHLSKFNIPMAEYRELHRNSMEELTVIGEELGYPLMLKSKTQAYDGRGNYRVQTQADIPSALEALNGRPLYAEKWANFRMELAVIVVKTKVRILSFPTVETIQEDSICKLVYAPARNISDIVNRKAQELAKNAVAAFEGKGVFGVEMFLLEDDTLLLCELASRIHNSGHYTIEACSLSQFDAHLRAILDLPIPIESLELRQPAIMLNILGGSTPNSHLKIAERALSIPNASIHLYSKGAARPGRKMGHVTITAPTMHQAETIIQPLIDFMDDICVQRTNVLFQPPKPQTSIASSKPPPTIGVIMGSDSDLRRERMQAHSKTLRPEQAVIKPPTPLVLVTMGSDSDLPVLKAGLDVLTQFGVLWEVDITSAHRTPFKMGEVATQAAARGIKIIIAGAGGAAHLPGMLAAYTPLPVIGIPVKATHLDGLDSLLSIVQMPRGVPTATVGINNSVNAALLAIRFLGAFIPELHEKMKMYQIQIEKQVEDKASLLREIDVEAYLARMNKK